MDFIKAIIKNFCIATAILVGLILLIAAFSTFTVSEALDSSDVDQLTKGQRCEAVRKINQATNKDIGTDGIFIRGNGALEKGYVNDLVWDLLNVEQKEILTESVLFCTGTITDRGSVYGEIYSNSTGKTLAGIKPWKGFYVRS